MDVHLMLVRCGQLLFTRRAASGLWLLPTSRLRAGETVATGACRTAAEQVNLFVARPDVRVAHVRRISGGTEPRLALFIEVRQFRGVPFVTDRRIFDRLAWYPPTKLPTPVASHVAAVVSAWDKQIMPGWNPPTRAGDEPTWVGGTADEGQGNR